MADHPALSHCGELTVNGDAGVRVQRHLPRRHEAIIERFLQQADASPGVAIAVVADGQVVYLRGFGFSDLADCTRVTPDTRFYLRSTTKHFLGVAAAILHEQGAIALDAPIGEYLPELVFPQGLRADQASLRSHLTHTHPTFSPGLNYRTAFPGNLPEAQFVDYLNEFSQPRDIRFRYSNVGPIMAAHAIGTKIERNWRDFIAEEVLAAAGMHDSFTRMSDAERGPMAQGYVGATADDFEPELTKTDAQMHAAGGLVSTASDMARWLLLNLDAGRIAGEQLLPRRAVEQAQARQVQLDARFGEITRFAYGLGLYSGDYDGELLLHHFGGETHFSFMPEHGLGVVILANEFSFAGRMTHELALTIYDLLRARPEVETRIARRLASIDERRAGARKRLADYFAQATAEAPQAAPTFDAKTLAGTYRDARLGDMLIDTGADRLTARFGAIEGAVKHLGGDHYIADIGLWGIMPPAIFVFSRNDDGRLQIDWGGRIFERQPGESQRE